MRINNNIAAINTHRQYGINNAAIAKSTEKLSSGYRINRAGDDAAGLAISEKMRAQIRGLNMASKNSQDAISLVQTAEGALQESHNILQRMRELAVQSASDTNETTIDRDALNKEFQQLIAELDETARTTRFNDMNLIDGTFQASQSFLTGITSSLAKGAVSITDAMSAIDGAYSVGATFTDAVAFQAAVTGVGAKADFSKIGESAVVGKVVVTSTTAGFGDGTGGDDTVEIVSAENKGNAISVTFKMKDGEGVLGDETFTAEFTYDPTIANQAVITAGGSGAHTVEITTKVGSTADDVVAYLNSKAGDTNKVTIDSTGKTGTFEWTPTAYVATADATTFNDGTNRGNRASAGALLNGNWKLDVAQADPTSNLITWTLTQVDDNGVAVANGKKYEFQQAAGAIAQGDSGTVALNFGSEVGTLNVTLANHTGTDALNTAAGVDNNLAAWKADLGGIIKFDEGVSAQTQVNAQDAITEFYVNVNGVKHAFGEGDIRVSEDGKTSYVELANLGLKVSFNGAWDKFAMESSKEAMNKFLGGTINSTERNSAGRTVSDMSFNFTVNSVEGKDFVVQTGANQGDELSINIDRMDSEFLGVNSTVANIATREDASKAITQVNDAINQVSSQRASLGALQNRLNHKIANLDTSAENLQSAESRIRDIDMAKEMTNFTRNNILSQAATAMLAQANAAPQGVLQLLG